MKTMMCTKVADIFELVRGDCWALAEVFCLLSAFLVMLCYVVLCYVML